MAKKKVIVRSGLTESNPQFDPNCFSGFRTEPYIIPDTHGQLWRVDPQTGVVSRVHFKL